MKKIFAGLLIATIVLFEVGCYTHHHIVGNGAKGNTEVTARQWYILFGLVPLNNVDTKEMAAGATDYEIITQTSFLDIVMNMFTGYITVYSRTVEVKK